VAAAAAGIVAAGASADAGVGFGARSLAWAPVPSMREDPTISDAVFL
jgi:hypothetical protein